MSADHHVVEIEGQQHPVVSVTGSVSIGITRYFRPPLDGEVCGRLHETPIVGGEPVRILRRPDARTFVVKRVPVREKAP